jgi:hypothetical protein
MKRFLVLLAAASVAEVALADIAPPKGQKRVVVDYRITADKEIPGYEFYTVLGRTDVAPVKLGPKSPVLIRGAGRGGAARFGALTAVPAGSRKKYDSEKEFREAIRANKVEGQVSAKNGLPAVAVVKDTDPRETIVMEYAFEKIDGKQIVLKEKGKPKPGGTKDAPEEEDSPNDAPAAIAAPRGGTWVAGAVASLGVMLGGLWLAGRARRKA